MRRIILALSGASAMPLAATLLRALAKSPDIEIHLIVSQGADLVLQYEGNTSGLADTSGTSVSGSLSSGTSVSGSLSSSTSSSDASGLADACGADISASGISGTDSSASDPALGSALSLACPDFSLAHVRHDAMDFSAGPASGSWQHDGMIICPCSMSTLASIANGIGSNLVHRAADVTLKERRPLILVTRETPLSRIHLRNMLTASEAGATIMPPCPAFYHNPQSIQDILDHTAGRILDQVHIPHTLSKRWRDA